MKKKLFNYFSDIVFVIVDLHEKYSNTNTREIQKIISTYFEKEYVNNTNKPANLKRKITESETEKSDELSDYMFKRTKLDKTSKEINKYLALPLSNKKVNMLEYWKTNRAEFPFLSNMARDMLPVQSGSVSVERDFAGAVDVVTPTRCSLKHNTIRALMCVKSWSK